MEVQIQEKCGKKKSVASLCIEITICTAMLSREVHQFRFLLLWYKMDFFRNSIDTARKTT